MAQALKKNGHHSRQLTPRPIQLASANGTVYAASAVGNGTVHAEQHGGSSGSGAPHWGQQHSSAMIASGAGFAGGHHAEGEEDSDELLDVDEIIQVANELNQQESAQGYLREIPV